MSTDLSPAVVLRGAQLVDGRQVDVEVVHGIIAAIRPHDASWRTIAADGPATLDLHGQVLLPGLVEPHAHLDKALTAAAVENPSGDLDGAIRAWLAARAGFDVHDIAERAERAARLLVARGTTTIRTHVDTGPDIGLRAVEALLDVRDRLVDVADLQVIACAGLPLTGRVGSRTRALLDDALAAGADGVGGAPWLDPDPAAAVRILADAAAKYEVPLDAHVDETLDPRSLTVAHLIDLADEGFAHPITASHAVSLGSQPVEVQRRHAERLAAAGVGVVVLPVTNLFLQARGHVTSPPRGLAPMLPLLGAGVAVGAGGDNVRDPFNLLGRSDPLDIASLLVAAAHLTVGQAVEAVTDGARASIGAPPLRIEVGARADLVAIRATDIGEAVATGPVERTVLRAGRPVVTTTSRTRWEVGAPTPRRRFSTGRPTAVPA